MDGRHARCNSLLNCAGFRVDDICNSKPWIRRDNHVIEAAFAGKVRVYFDHTGHDPFIRRINYLVSFRNVYIGCFSNGFNHSIFDEYDAMIDCPFGNGQYLARLDGISCRLGHFSNAQPADAQHNQNSKQTIYPSLTSLIR